VSGAGERTACPGNPVEKLQVREIGFRMPFPGGFFSVDLAFATVFDLD
jgi:hypothetical protein